MSRTCGVSPVGIEPLRFWIMPTKTMSLVGSIQNQVPKAPPHQKLSRPCGLPHGLDSFWWGGAFGTWFWIDPTNDIVFVGMIQNLNGSIPTGETPQVRDISPRAVYAALSDKKA